MTTKKVYKDIKRFTIKRSEWRRGGETTALRNKDNTKCCLGFYAQACGFKGKMLDESSEPADINNYGKAWDTFLVKKSNHAFSNHMSSMAATSLILINDDDKITEAARERKISTIFARRNIKVKFED